MVRIVMSSEVEISMRLRESRFEDSSTALGMTTELDVLAGN